MIGIYDNTDSEEIRESHLEKLTHVVFFHTNQFLTANGIEFGSDKDKFRFEKLRNKAKSFGLKVMISIGRELHFFTDNFTNFELRCEFLKFYLHMYLINCSKLTDSIVSFLDEHQVDGVDLFWKWPTASDKSKYLLFVDL